MELAGIQIADPGIAHLQQALYEWSGQTGQQHTVGYLNAHVYNQCWEDPAVYRQLTQADLVYADGNSLRLAARLTGQKPPRRMTSADWLDEMLVALLNRGRKIFLLGGEEGVASSFGRHLESKGADGSGISGFHTGYWSSGEDDAVVDMINQSGAQLLVIGMGTPWQERFVDRCGVRLQAGCLWWIGAGMDYFTGHQQRGPAWTRMIGQEWLGRLLADPIRLSGRYLRGNPLFVFRILARSVPGAAP